MSTSRGLAVAVLQLDPRPAGAEGDSFVVLETYSAKGTATRAAPSGALEGWRPGWVPPREGALALSGRGVGVGPAACEGTRATLVSLGLPELALRVSCSFYCLGGKKPLI